MNTHAEQTINEAQPHAIHYTQGRQSATRRQQKHELWLTFVNNTSTPKRKHNPKQAPTKPSLLHSLLSILA